MLPVGDQPMLEILLEQCIENGFRRFFFSVNYLKEQIIAHFGDGSRWRVSIDYLVENEPLGTAGSLQLLPDSVKEPFLVLNGDVLTRLNPSQLLQFHREHEAQATLCECRGVRDQPSVASFAPAPSIHRHAQSAAGRPVGRLPSDGLPDP
jgi:NDP-sugar pyrophosphorylase family protein